jgi:hypothetical protein
MASEKFRSRKMNACSGNEFPEAIKNAFAVLSSVARNLARPPNNLQLLAWVFVDLQKSLSHREDSA